MRMQAVWNGVVLADSEDTIVVEGNHYFPFDSVDQRFFTATKSHTLCPWKGIASYYTVTVDGSSYPDAAWQYKKPLPLARRVKNRIAFWPAIAVVPADDTTDTRPPHGGRSE